MISMRMKTRAERKAAIAILKKAHERIRHRLNAFVCIAVHYSPEGEDEMRIAREIMRRISLALGSHTNVTVWLIENDPMGGWEDVCGYTAREYRLRWIESMIAENEELAPGAQEGA